ncbi:MAG: hypothetical protein ABSH56_02445 [Bryobacteraceae bacterium]
MARCEPLPFYRVPVFLIFDDGTDHARVAMYNFSTMRISTLGVLVICGFSAPAYGGVALSENFDELTPALTQTSVGAFSAINGTNVDILGGSVDGSLCVSPESGNCIDVNGTGGNPQGQLESNMEFTAGGYLLSFDLIGDQRGSTASVTVTFGSYDQEFTLGSGDITGGIVVNQPVTLTAPGYLLVASDVTGNIGLLLDDVVVATPSASGTPEPSSFCLLGSVLLVVIAGRRFLTHARCRP